MISEKNTEFNISSKKSFIDEQEEDLIEFNQNKNTFHYGETFHSTEIRLLFTKKVFTIILLQIILNITSVILFYNLEVFKNLMINFIWIHYIAFGITILIIIILGGFPNISTKTPYNVILLFVFLFTTSYVMGYFTIFYNPLHIMIGSIICFSSILSVVIYSWVSSNDLNMVRAAFFIFGFSLASTLTMFYFSFDKYLEICISFGIAIVIGFYCIYEMKNILGNCEEIYGSDDYIYAFMSFYSDLVMIFIDILIKLGNKG